jgi:hypothetical protein
MMGLSHSDCGEIPAESFVISSAQLKIGRNPTIVKVDGDMAGSATPRRAHHRIAARSVSFEAELQDSIDAKSTPIGDHEVR